MSGDRPPSAGRSGRCEVDQSLSPGVALINQAEKRGILRQRQLSGLLFRVNLGVEAPPGGVSALELL
jgi:hypothetical protein